MSLVVMGANYKTAPIAHRERAAVPQAEMRDTLRGLVAGDDVREAALLSTCNRVELYLEAKTDRLGTDAARAFFEDRLGKDFDPDEFYLHRSMDAVRHVYRVVCSLDSQVLGEAQIIGQMRGALEQAQAAGTAGEKLDRLLKGALTLGKRAHADTAIGSDSVSLSTTAFHAACSSVPDISKCAVAIVGSGKMADLIAKYLSDIHVASVAVTSRTPEHAGALARRLGGAAIPWERRHDAVARADVAFTMVTAGEPVIGAEALRDAREHIGRGSTPLVIVDIGVPRNVAADVASLPGVTLYNQEQLDSIIDENISARLSSVGEVEQMVEEAVEGYLAWMQERLVVPTIKEMREKCDLIVAKEMQRACKSLRRIEGRDPTDDEKRVLEAYGASIVNKVLHGPTVRLRKESTTADSYYYTGAARYLFGLEVYPPGTKHKRCSHECEAGGACPNGVPPDAQVNCGKAV